MHFEVARDSWAVMLTEQSVIGTIRLFQRFELGVESVNDYDRTKHFSLIRPRGYWNITKNSRFYKRALRSS